MRSVIRNAARSGIELSASILKYTVPGSLKPYLKKPYKNIQNRIDTWGYPEGLVVVKVDNFEMTVHPKRSLLGRALYDNTDFIKEMRIMESEFEDVFAEFCFDDMTIFDVGSNWGYFSLILHSNCDPDIVVAFEPHPDNVATLRDNIRRNALNVDIVPKAVSDEISTTTMWDHGIEADHNSLSTDSYTFGEPDEQDEFTVETITLDEYIRQNTINQVDFVKVDVEGAEGNVLTGISSSWDAIKGVGIEVHDARMTDFGYEPADLIYMLREHGPFEIYHFDNNGNINRIKDTESEKSINKRFSMTPETIHILVALRPDSRIAGRFNKAIADRE